MANSINVSVGLDPTSVSNSANALGKALATATSNALNKGFSQASFKINDRQFTQPLGSMTSRVKEFDTVLASANKRVLGFGVSLGLIGGAVRGFKELVSATVDVERSLSKITSLMPLTVRQLDSVRKGLFDIARQTGETFDEVSEGFEETSRQGVTLEQTLKRTTAAASLARVANISVGESVKGLTAAFSTFGRAGETYVGIANKISAANRVTLAGAKDLFDVIGQFGEQAQDAGISLNRLIGIASTLQTQTGRGGGGLSVSLQRILSRVDSPSTQKSLAKVPELDLTDQNGQVKQGIALLDELAKKYNTLSDASKKLVNQSIGSTRDQNVFSNLVKDINDANGSVAKITQVIALSTNDLSSRLIQQNNNLATSFTNLATTAKQAGSTIGELTIKPILSSLIGSGNFIGSIFGNVKASGSTKPAEDFGAYLGESILKGIGNVIAGPGLVLLSRLVVGAASKTIPEVLKDARQTIGYSAPGSNTDASALRGVNALLAQATTEEQRRLRYAQDTAEEEQVLLGILRRQNEAYAEQAGIQARISQGALGGANRGAFVGFGEHVAGGYVNAMSAESIAVSRGVGGAPSGSRAVMIPHFAYGGGQSGPIVANTSEFVVPGAGGSSIYNRDMIKSYGLPPGSTPVAAGGFMGNAAGGLPSAIDLAMAKTTPPIPSAVEVAMARSDQLIKAFDQRVIGINESLAKLAESFQTELQARKSRAAQIENMRIVNGSNGPRVPQRNPITGRYTSPNEPVVFPNGGIDHESDDMMGRNRAGRGVGSPYFIGPSYPSGSTPYIDSIGKQVEQQVEQQRKVEEVARVRNETALASEKRAQAKAESDARFQNRLQYGAIGASILAGFIPQGAGGTRGGQINGGLSGALQGASTGAFLGGIIPGGAVPGAAIGGILGGINGIIDKTTKSFDELAQSLQNIAAKNDQIIRSTNEYAQNLDNLQKAAASGASTDEITTLRRQAQASFSSIPVDIRNDITSARNDPQKLAGILANLDLTIAKSNNKAGAISSIAAYANGANDTTRSSAIDALLGTSNDSVNPTLFSPTSKVSSAYLQRHRNDLSLSAANLNPIKGENLENLQGALSKSTNLNADDINNIIQQLSKLDIGEIVKWEQSLVEAFKNHQDLGPVVDAIEDQKVNIGKFQAALQDEIDASQDVFNQRTGAASFQRQRSGQVIGAASRILGGGKVKIGNQLLGGDQLADSYRVSESQQEAGLGVSQIGIEIQNALRAQLKDSPILGTERGQVVQDSIRTASTPDDFKAILAGNKTLDTKAIDRLIDKMAQAVAAGKNQVQLTIESIGLQRLELQATQQSQLLSRGIYNPSSVSSFNSLARAGLGDTSPRGVNSLIQQGELLDQLGLAKGPNTASLDTRLRTQSVTNELRSLASRRLGRQVSAGGIGSAADELIGTGVTSNVELGQRIHASQNLLGFNPRAEIQKLLTDSSSTSSVDLTKLVDSKTITAGDAAIIKAIETLNETTGKIPGVSSTPQTNPVKTTVTTPDGAPAKAQVGANGVITLPTETVTARGPGFNAGTSVSPLSAFSGSSGFGAGLNDIYDKLGNSTEQLQDIGKETANNLDNSFSTFFGNFVNGTVRSNRAFREFASSIFSDESKLFASNAVHNLFGALSSTSQYDNSTQGTIDQLFGPSQGDTNSFITRAQGGSVPALLTGGEYVIPPDAARRLGPRALNTMNQGRAAYAAGGLVRGGSGIVDDVPAALAPGSFVVKASSVRSLGPRYLGAMSKGGFLRRERGGLTPSSNVDASQYYNSNDIDNLINNPATYQSDNGFGGNGGLSAAQAQQIEAFASTYDPDNNPYGNPFDTDDSAEGSNAYNPNASSSTAGLQQVGTSLASSAILAAIAYLSAPSSPKALGYDATRANATTLETDIRNGVNSRPAGTFVNEVRGPNGQYNIIDANSPAIQYRYGDSGGTQLYPQTAAAGGSIGGSYVPLSDGSTSSTVTSVNPTITIHNYGNGNTSSTTTPGGASNSNQNPLATQDFADKLNKQVQAVVNDTLVTAQRNGGLFNTKSRYSPNQYT